MFNNIKRIKNSHKGERCFIIANGPSVLGLKLGKLKNETVISMNAAPLLEKRFGFHSKYYVVSDLRFFDVDFKRELAFKKEKNRNVTCVYRQELAPFVKDRRNNYFTNAIGRDGFSNDLRHGFFFGCTTTMLAIQLAYYLGFKDIYLLGVDLSYPKGNARFYKEDNPSPIDLNNCIQIHNIRNAYHKMQSEQTNLHICSKKSLLRPYIPYAEFEELFS